MKSKIPMKIIGHISTDFPTKFGIPRQSGLVPELRGTIRLEKEYQNPDALRGLSDYSHIWLIWLFSESIRENWSPTVRPPRLGGNRRMGVFATRSPYRPNPIGLSVVKLESVELSDTKEILIHVSGADLMDGTPILDIKPYLPHVDAIPDAVGGFSDACRDYHLEVDFPPELQNLIPKDRQSALFGVLAGDPRPSYQNDPERIYGMVYGEYEVRFRVEGGVLHVCQILKSE
ncbi:MAG: tRNA (N6-threonylcarbamoyladenosine(37)-N6)-methyltransferase TrmO [Eubacteriales bacterium]